MYTIGIDVGTTHIKACLIDESFKVMSVIIQDSPIKTDIGMGKCCRAEDLWDTVKICIRKLIENVDPLDIGAIGITSMAESGVPVDDEGNALLPIIPWNDAASNSSAFSKQFDGYELYMRTGLIDHPKYTIHRILWMKREKPDIFDRMYCWLSVADYIIYRLTGEYVTDDSLASRTMLYNIGEGKWDDGLVSLSGMDGRLPAVINTGKPAGIITHAAADELGLNEDVRIVPAGQDHLSAAVAANIEDGRGILNSMGTSEVYVGFQDKPDLSADCYNCGIMQGRFGNRYYWMGNIPASGGSIEWLKGIFSPAGKMDYRMFSDNPKITEPSDLFYYPYLNGSGTPHADPMMRGAFFGLSSGTADEDMIQAVYEGIAMESRWIVNSLKECLKTDTTRIIAVGGGTKNPYLMKTKADILDSEIYCSSLSEATSAGAALQAANAVLNKRNQISDVYIKKVEPNTKLKGYYDNKYQKYRSAYSALKNVLRGDH